MFLISLSLELNKTKKNLPRRKTYQGRMLTILVLFLTIVKILALDMDLLVPTSEVDLAKQTTHTRIYLDFKIFTLNSEETDQIFEVFKNIFTLIKPEPDAAVPDILNNVLSDLTSLKRTIREINLATQAFLTSDINNHKISHCTFTRQILAKKTFKDLIESLQLVSKKFPPDFLFSPQDKLKPDSQNFQLLSESLLSIKGIIHEFLTLFDRQFSAISVLETFKIPSETALNLDLNKCIRTFGKETFLMEKLKYYDTGALLTIKLTQTHDFDTFHVLKPIPIFGVMLDLNHLYHPISDNATFYHQICTEFHNINNCQLSIINNPCLDAIKLKQIPKILQACPIVLPTQIIPFLTLHGVFIPENSEITFLDPATQSTVQNHSLSLPPPPYPYLLQSEFTIKIDFNDSSYLFGPTALVSEVIHSYLTSDDFAFIHYFLHPYLNPTYQIYFSIVTVFSITCSLIVFLSIKLLKPKTKKYKKTKYVASIHKTRSPSFKKVKK